MASEDQAADKLREYLRDLTPEARAMLMAEVERGILRGEEIPQAQLLLRQLRETLRADDRLPERIGNPARLFFSPLEPFIVDDALAQTQGRIPRAYIAPVWEWICSDIAEAEAKAYCDDVSRFLLANDTAKAEQAARAFQDRVVRRIRDALAGVGTDNYARRQLVFRVGTPRAHAHVQEIVTILKARDALAAIASRIPLRIRNLADDQLDAIVAMLDTALARQPEFLVYAFVLVMNRLPAFWQLIRIAIKAAQSDAADRIVDTPYAPAVTIVLAEIERMVRELSRDLKRGRATSAATQLKEIHEAVRGLRAEMDLPVGCDYARRLGAIRAQIADFLKPELDALPGRVRRLLRHTQGRQIARGAVVDASEVAEVEAMIGFVTACRTCASELALNEMTTRVCSELQNYLETGTHALLDALRNASDADRGYRQSQVDAAVRFCARTFGQEYAALLARAAEVAANSERKSVNS